MRGLGRRPLFFAGLAAFFGMGGKASAQQRRLADDSAPITATCTSMNFKGSCVPYRDKPANGECPVCGTRAPKFKAEEYTTVKFTRCAHCSAAFYQAAG